MPDSRVRLGQEKVGLPIMQTYEALGYTIDRKGWKRFRKQPIYYYFDRMLGQWLIESIDGCLDDAQLRELEPDESRIITLLLIRDMLRHNGEIVWWEGRSGAWIGAFFDEVAQQLDLPLDRFEDDGQPYNLAEGSETDWASRLARPLGISALELFASHAAIVKGVANNFKTMKPWWRLW